MCRPHAGGWDARGFPGCCLPRVPSQGGAGGLPGRRDSVWPWGLGLGAWTHFCPWGGGDGCEGLSTAPCDCFPPGRDRAPRWGHRSKSAQGFDRSPGAAEPAALLPFPLWPDGTLPTGTAGAGVGPCLCLPAEPAAAAAHPAPPQAQGGGGPEDAGVRAHDPLPRVLGCRPALRPPQPPREPEQRRHACAQRPAAQGGTGWTGAARGRGALLAGASGRARSLSVRPSVREAGQVPAPRPSLLGCAGVWQCPGGHAVPVVLVPGPSSVWVWAACGWGRVQRPLVPDNDGLFSSLPGHPPATPPDP